MTFEFTRILDGKRLYWRKLAALPVEEMIQTFDALHERVLLLRQSRVISTISIPSLGAATAKTGTFANTRAVSGENGVLRKTTDFPKPEFGNEEKTSR